MVRTSSGSAAPLANGASTAVSDAEEASRQRSASDKDTASGNSDITDEFEWEDPTYKVRSQPVPLDDTLLPGGRRSLSAIGLQAFLLGFLLAASLLLLSQFTLETPHSAWRLPAYFTCLSIFHFLEYWTTARFNVPAARASSFLLYSNGFSYNLANACAVVEATVNSFTPGYRDLLVNDHTILAGCLLIVVGQVVRSVAMSQAGTNFNHTPAKTKREGHVLVTRGIYSWLRHPSYFGFFWWALGTQLLVGNKVCLFGYAVVLWLFFHHRIIAEEKTLTRFFGRDYEEFKEKTGTGLPFIR